MDEFLDKYDDIHNENVGLVDKAGTSNKGKPRLSERWREWRFRRRYCDACGERNVFRKGVEICKTDGGILEIGSDCTFDKGAVLLLTKPKPALHIGDNVTIGRGSIVSVKSECTIGSFTLIGPNVQIQDSNHSIRRDNLIKYQRAEVESISIGADCWIGAGAKILSGVKIGDGAVIGANAVVTKDVPEFAIAVGCPARVIRYRD